MITPEFITANWPLTNVRIEKLLQQSGTRSTHVLTANEGKFVLKIADHSKNQTDIERDTFVFNFLREQKYKHLPELLLAQNGDHYIPVKEQFAFVLGYIEGVHPQSVVSTWHRMAELTAQLHQITEYPFGTTITVTTERPKFLEDTSRLRFEKEYQQLAQELPDFTDVPQRLIHTDIGLHNTIQRSDGELIFVDWDDAGVGARILDLGYPLICQFISHDLVIDTANAKAFYARYQELEPLTKTEKEQLFDAGLFFALMYSKYGDSEKNWQRIQFAIQNKSQLIHLFQ
ncbi:MAG: phosphotransferase [Candidatus Buchananbacteria bacterium]|nr:phosphotransferase [Candidatus Buchananbacteria bacterium]